MTLLSCAIVVCSDVFDLRRNLTTGNVECVSTVPTPNPDYESEPTTAIEFAFPYDYDYLFNFDTNVVLAGSSTTLEVRR